MIMALLFILAQVGASGPPPAASSDSTLKILLPWITSFVLAVLGAVGCRHFRQKGREEGKHLGVVVKPPVPTINTQEVPRFVTHDDLNEVKRDLEEIKVSLGSDRNVARTANGNLHKRIDGVMEDAAEIKGKLSEVGANVSRLLDIAMKRPTR